MATAGEPADDDVDLTVDEVASRAGVPTRTVREYQTLGLLPPPEKRGRIGIYRTAHVQRLQLIGRLQARGYSLAGIRDLLASWHEGHELTDILGLDPDELVHVDEPGAPATIDQLAEVLPKLVPDRMDELLEVGLIDRCSPDRYCVPSPSLLQLAREALAAGYSPSDVLRLLTAVHEAAELVAATAHKLLSRPPSRADSAALERLTTRGRGLLSHGTGRLTIYELGRRIDGRSSGRARR
jgi:DNA-binding transcriptional MerR regulator